MGEPDAVVVGSGPNGLAAAVTLARAGLSVTVLEGRDEIGGGTRTAELTLPGLVHDVCSASHPFGVASPFFRSLPLERHGLEWRWTDVELAHPLANGRVGVLRRSVDETAAGLGAAGAAWRRVFGPLVDGFDDVAEEVLQPILHVPRHPIWLARFGLRAVLPATVLGRMLRSDEAAALFAGSAAHIFTPLDRPFTSSVGLMLTAAAHAVGWPVAVGGSSSITAALAGVLTELGGRIETGVTVTDRADLPAAATVLFDTAPSAAARILADDLPTRTRRAYHRWRHGPAAFKVDLAVDGGVPWTAEACRHAGVVHVGGPLAEIAAAEKDTWRGRLAERPFTLVGQQYLADPARSVGDVHPVWAYAHVPHGYDGDATDLVIDHIERYAPGLRDRIVARAVMTPADFASYNPNYVGGDISTGANDLRQLVLRPAPRVRPYATGVPDAYLCSAATPPGAGVHGMCGHHAARAALADLGIADASTA